MKRLIIATVSGLLFGFVCFGFACSSGEIPLAVTLQIVASRTLIGFSIGISVLNVHWSLHGMLMGLLFSLPLGLSTLLALESPDMSKELLFVSTIVMGVIYGFLIELITSIFFKAKR